MRAQAGQSDSDMFGLRFHIKMKNRAHPLKSIWPIRKPAAKHFFMIFKKPLDKRF